MTSSDPAYQPVPALAPAHGSSPAGDGASKSGRPSVAAGLILAFAVGGAVAIGVGAYGRLHTPTKVAVNLAGFSGPQAVKTWLATAAILFAIVQVVSALAMYGKLPRVRNAPAWTSTVHRWSGRVAFLLTIPVAMHCLYALGYQDFSARVLIHSVLGCFFFGAFVAKMLLLTRKGMPGWALPVFGGLAFTALVGLWLTSALWFFTTIGVRF